MLFRSGLSLGFRSVATLARCSWAVGKVISSAFTQKSFKLSPLSLYSPREPPGLLLCSQSFPSDLLQFPLSLFVAVCSSFSKLEEILVEVGVRQLDQRARFSLFLLPLLLLCVSDDDGVRRSYVLVRALIARAFLLLVDVGRFLHLLQRGDGTFALRQTATLQCPLVRLLFPSVRLKL